MDASVLALNIGGASAKGPNVAVARFRLQGHKERGLYSLDSREYLGKSRPVVATPPESDDTALKAGARAVVRRLREAGFVALWAGGCVRDQVMGFLPKDYDVATDARPEQVKALFDHTIGVGAQFGVMLVVLGEDLAYEVATFRAEADYTDGRRPERVRWASAREDVLRRDFTINGLLYDPEDDELVDYVGGRSDIEAGLIRAIGDPHERFAEDKLRLLRAVRFAARLGFQIEQTTYTAIKRHANEIVMVSAERIAAEYDRILGEGGATRGLELLEDSGLLRVTLPELGLPERAMMRFHDRGRLDVDTAWATLLLEVEPDRLPSVPERMRMSRKRQKSIAESAVLAQRLQDYLELSVARKKRLIREPEAGRALEIAHRAAEVGQWPKADVAAAISDAARWRGEALHPPRWVDGATLKHIGLTPGPHFKHILEAVEDAQLEGRVTTQEEAEALARELAG